MATIKQTPAYALNPNRVQHKGASGGITPAALANLSRFGVPTSSGSSSTSKQSTSTKVSVTPAKAVNPNRVQHKGASGGLDPAIIARIKGFGFPTTSKSTTEETVQPINGFQLGGAPTSSGNGKSDKENERAEIKKLVTINDREERKADARKKLSSLADGNNSQPIEGDGSQSTIDKAGFGQKLEGLNSKAGYNGDGNQGDGNQSTTAKGGGGNCPVPSSRDAIGNKCGGRAASVR